MNPEGYCYAYRKTAYNPPKTDPKPRYNCGDMVSLRAEVKVGNVSRTIQTVGKVVGVYIDPDSSDNFLYDINHNELIFRSVSQNSL